MENATCISADNHPESVQESCLSPSDSGLWLFAAGPYLAALLAGYILLCNILRFRMSNHLKAKFRNRSLSTMTDSDAHYIIQKLNSLEFPSIQYQALQIALFRTYGIPSISKLLRATTQLSASATVAKRYTDTAGLISEIYLNAPSSERGMQAFARLNYLHSHYIVKGLISNDDMLYTLALFMNHPIEFFDKYEWRKATEVERCAMGVWHCSMARAMNIDLNVLPGSGSGWKDGLQFYDELDNWAKEYEKKFMVPDTKNFEVAIQTSNFLKSTFPAFMHGTIQQVICAIIDDRLREAIMFEKAGWLAPRLIDVVVETRRFVLRYLALPRPEFLKFRMVDDENNADGRRNFIFFEGMPYYVKPTLLNQYGPSAWARRFMGLPLPGDKGMMSEGYLMQDFGPARFHGKGAEEAEITMQRLRKERTGGCPFMVR